MSASDHDVGAFLSIKIGFEPGWFKRLMGVGIIAVPAQDMVAGAPDENVG